MTYRYRVIITPSAERDYYHIPARERSPIKDIILSLGDHPRPLRYTHPCP